MSRFKITICTLKLNENDPNIIGDGVVYADAFSQYSIFVTRPFSLPPLFFVSASHTPPTAFPIHRHRPVRATQVEDCIDLSLEPRPVGYGASRRMARRFDETLIVEVEMVASKESSGRIF